MNAQQYAPSPPPSSSSSSAAASFTYQPSAAVSWVAPARALAEGGAPLTVRGRGFSSASEALARLLCRVGGASRRAAWGSDRSVACVAPRARASEATVEVSNNAREYTSASARLRLVWARVLGVEPWSGPRRGATLVRVRARGSLPSRAACRFGGDAVAAALASSASASGGRSPSRVGGASRVVCASAPSASTGWVGVRVVGSYGGAVSSGGGFYYHRRVRVRGAAPPLGPSRGGTRVAVVGGGFRDAYTLRCRLENASRAVLARYVDESQLECASPVHSVGAKAVGVSMNAQQYAPAASSAAAASFTYQPSAAVSWVAPARALAEGGAPLTVRGRGFSSASEALARLLCRVGGASRRAAWGSDRSVACVAPRARASEATVEVSNNAREYTSASARLRLVWARVLGVEPWSGPRRGATLVRVRARGSLPSRAACRFGGDAVAAALASSASASGGRSPS